MKQIIIAAISLMALIAVPSQGASGHSKNHVEIYLTAKDMGQRLVKAGETELADSMPAVETEEYIRVHLWLRLFAALREKESGTARRSLPPSPRSAGGGGWALHQDGCFAGGKQVLTTDLTLNKTAPPFCRVGHQDVSG
jgi:hypothetical protein